MKIDRIQPICGQRPSQGGLKALLILGQFGVDDTMKRLQLDRKTVL